MRSKLKNFITNNTVEKTWRAGETVELAAVEKKETQFTYAEGDEVCVGKLWMRSNAGCGWVKYEEGSRVVVWVGRWSEGRNVHICGRVCHPPFSHPPYPLLQYVFMDMSTYEVGGMQRCGVGGWLDGGGWHVGGWRGRGGIWFAMPHRNGAPPGSLFPPLGTHMCGKSRPCWALLRQPASPGRHPTSPLLNMSNIAFLEHVQ